ncbi:hypothetical protein QOZ80_5AG0372530 [Eleusine coracana subsp. coracana]|nr:hypothetical protein QOZ80_5AG0372530 [Eleusine coracana subsp. coracana]
MDMVADPLLPAGAQLEAAPDGAPADAAAGQQARQAMRWTSVMSSFVLRRFCHLISTGVRTDKGFKEVHLNQVAKDLQEFSGAEAHPKDAEFLNKPIENYQQMEIIFANGLATEKFTMGSSEALGSPSDFAESSLKSEDAKVPTEPSTKAQDVAGVGSKRKRSMLSDDDVIVMGGMTTAVNNVAEAIRETKVDDFHPDLYGAVMFMPGFIEEALMAAYSHLLDNKAHGSAFVAMSNSHRVLWLRTYLAKHYYIEEDD